MLKRFHFRDSADTASDYLGMDEKILDQKFIRDLIYGKFATASTMSNVVRGQAELYYQVSAQYVMPKVNRLPVVLALDPVNDKASKFKIPNFIILYHLVHKF